MSFVLGSSTIENKYNLSWFLLVLKTWDSLYISLLTLLTADEYSYLVPFPSLGRGYFLS